MLDTNDVTEFVRYRNITEVAQYQDWPRPYTRDLAHQLVDELDALNGPTIGHWVQLALEHGGQLIGDLAVWISDSGDLAMIGYTIAPEHQGRSFAVGAAEAVIDWLFRHRPDTHRIAATIDPRNMASARVLERCGFEYIGTARSSAFVRGDWTDDARFSLLRSDRVAWRRRPTAAPRDISFVEIDASNVRAVGAIEVAHSQRRFVSSVTDSIADAAHPPVNGGSTVRPWYRAITADGQLAGFVMLALPTDAQPTPILWRLLVDQWYQRRGIARRTICQVAEPLVEWGQTNLDVSFVDEPGGPEEFYGRLGFERTGRIEGGEIWATAPLAVLIERCR